MDDFFQAPKEQARIKSIIVSKYFYAWARVIKNTVKNRGRKIGYVDLFSGPGRYDDGTRSTPLLVLDAALRDADISQMLVAHFNDEDREHVESLKQAIKEIPGIEKLRYPPEVSCTPIGADTAKIFANLQTIPTLFFIDPCGYKGLSQKLFSAVIKDWGCEAIFFFNYNRINAAISNTVVRDDMDALFGHERVENLRKILAPLKSIERETEVMRALRDAILEGGQQRLSLHFRFSDDRGTRTSHHLIFVTKSKKGYEIMKEVMANASSEQYQGVSSFSYVPASPQQDFLFGFNRPLDDLGNDLLARFAGQTLTTKAIYDSHNVGTTYVLRNYKDILRSLYEKNVIQASRGSGKKIKKGFPDDIRVTFPRKD